MKLACELPHTICDCKSGGAWRIPPDLESSFAEAWMGGKAYWVGSNIYGEKIIVRLADVVGIITLTEKSLSRREAEQQEVKDRELLNSNES